MKVDEIIQQYAEGRRDFRNLNLRGKSFQEQNLVKADFSGCDLRGTNFRGAILERAIFHQAKAGLQKRWVIILILISCLISAFSGFLSILSGLLIIYFFRSNGDNMNQILGIILILFLIFILIVIIRQHLNVGTPKTIAIAIVLGGAISGVFSFADGITIIFKATGDGTRPEAVVLAITTSIAIAIAFGVAVAALLAMAGVLTIGGAIAEAIAFDLAGEVFGAINIVIAIAITGIVAFTLASTRAITEAFTGAIVAGQAVAIAVVFTITFSLVGAYLGWRSLKGDPRDQWIRQTAIAIATRGTSFYGADLTDADFTEATLKSTDLREANLIRTCWRKTKKLDWVRPGKTLLANPAVRDLMVTGKGENKSYEGANLRGANLKGVNLNYANLKFADLSKATLEEADLEYANLTEVNAVETDFTRAKMTGVCLEAWNIESNTKLDEVDCQFVYLLEHPKPKTDDRERRPSSGIFQPGEFTKLFQEVLNTVDLIFKDGINWQAFVTAFKKVQDENKDSPLKVQGIEDKGDGVIVVKLAVLTEANKENIHSSFVQNYNLALKSLETEYKAKLNLKDVEIDGYKRQNFNMLKIINLLANQPTNINTEAITVTENRSIKTGGGDYRENNFQDSRYIETRDSSTYYENYNESQKTLAKAAQEIQNLLKQLEQDNPTASETEKIDYINDETSKGFKKRVVAALMSGGETAIEEFLDSPYFNIAKAVVKGWMNPEG